MTCKHGNPYRHEMMIHLWRLMWPKTFIFESGGYLNEWALRMAKGFCEKHCDDAGWLRVFVKVLLRGDVLLHDVEDSAV